MASATTTTTPSPDDDVTIKLRSEDDEIFELPLGAANLSSFVSDALNEDDDGADSEVKVLRVRGDCLKKVVEFLIKYKEEPMKEIPLPLGGNTFAEIVTQEWYQQFVADEVVNRDMLFALLTAANYMGIKPLLDLTCLKVTFELTGKNAEEIRLILNLPPLTPEEEAKAREEHKWIFEDA